MPTQYCNASALENANTYGTLKAIGADNNTPPEKIEQLRVDRAKDLAAKILTDCKITKSFQDNKDATDTNNINQAPLEKLSGTSMSSPIVARLVAQKILETKLTGSAAIQALLQSAEKVQKGPLTLLKLKAAKPSWYKGTNNEFQALSSTINNSITTVNRAEVFEFFIPQTVK
jgi:hypothetical protein